MVERLALEQPAREKGRECQFRKNHQGCAARGRRFQQFQHPAQRVLARISFLGRPHLSGGGTDNSDQHCLQYVRIARSRGG